MVTRLPNLSWLRTFETAARLGSFTAAGGELGLTQAAVSHQVKALETQLGFSLFERGARSLSLTSMGRAYLPSVRKGIEDLTLSTQGLFGPKVRRSVTLRAPISTAVLWLAPRLKAFRALNPHIHVRLLSEIWADAIADSDVDLDIRLGEGSWPGCRAERLSTESVVPVSAPEAAASIRAPGDLRAFELIHIMGYQDHWSRFFRAAGADHDPEDFAISVDTSLAAIELVAAGGGVALLLRRFAEDLVAAGRLAIPLDQEVPLEAAHHLVSPASPRRPKIEARILADWLRASFAA